MSCNCKNKNTSSILGGSKESSPIWVSSISYSVKFIFYILGLGLIIPTISVYLIYFLFKLIVLNKNIDTLGTIGSLTNLGKKLTADKDEEEDDEDEEEEYEEDDLILTDYEDITVYDKNLVDVR